MSLTETGFGEKIHNADVQWIDKKVGVAYHPFFSHYYHDFYSEIIHLLNNGDGGSSEYFGKRFPIGFSKKQIDGSLFYAALGLTSDFSYPAVVAPAWFAPPFGESLYSVVEMANAFTKSCSEREPVLTDRFIAVFPYFELRQDKNTPVEKRAYWKMGSREAISAQIAADTLASNGVTEAIILEPHSAEALNFFKDKIDVLPLTAAPIFADWLIENGLIDDNVAIVALDEGTAQRCVRLQQILQVRTGKKIELVIFEKGRSGHSEITSQSIIYGNPSGKLCITFDDSGASFDTTIQGARVLKKCSSGDIYSLATHGVLAGKYVENLAYAQGLITRVVTTDSLPQVNEAEYLPVGIETIKIAQTLGVISRELSLSTMDSIRKNPMYSDFILPLVSKSEIVRQILEKKL